MFGSLLNLSLFNKIDNRQNQAVSLVMNINKMAMGKISIHIDFDEQLFIVPGL